MCLNKHNSSAIARALLNRLKNVITSIIKCRSSSACKQRALEERLKILEEKRLRICRMHPEWPRTLDDATASTIAMLSKNAQTMIMHLTENELIKCHWALGRDIRHRFGMWTFNTELLESCGFSRPDEASMVIIRNVWETLRSSS